MLICSLQKIVRYMHAYPFACELPEHELEFADGVVGFALSDGAVDSFINLVLVSNPLTGSSSRILRLSRFVWYLRRRVETLV
jgi:hypothetical protein